MKRICKKCKALCKETILTKIYPYRTIRTFVCKLGYKMKRQFWLGIEVYPIPLEECPRPLSCREYWFQKKQAEGGIKPKCLSLN